MMKTPFYLYILIVGLQTVSAQGVDHPRYIEVTGKADTLLMPTTYYYFIEPVVPEDPYTDYTSMSKGDRYMVLQKHKERALEIVQQIKALLTQEGVTENDYLKKKYDLEDADAASRYLLFKVGDLKKLERIVEKLRAPKFCKGEVYGIFSASEAVARKELQLKALVKARDQAVKLLAAAGAKPGAILQLTDKEDVAGGAINNSANYDGGDYNFNRKIFNNNTFIVVHDGRFESALNKTVYISQTVTAKFLIE